MSTTKAKTEPREPIRILHLSDFHFDAKRRWDSDPVLVGLAELDLNGKRTRLVLGGARDARGVLTALGVADLNPPPSRKRGAKPPETAV